MLTSERYHLYLSALLAGDRGSCQSVLSALLAEGVEAKRLYVDLFQRSMLEIGEKWERHEISVATEHLSSALTESLLSEVFVRFCRPHYDGRRAVIACVCNEYHQIGARIVSDYLESQGWRAHFLGANTSPHSLERFVESNPVDLVGLSIGTYFNRDSLETTLESLATRFPGLPVMVGGQALTRGLGSLPFQARQVFWVSSLERLSSLLSELP